MKSLLEAIYGNKLEKYKAEKLSLPLYLLDGREIVDVSICGCSFNLVILKSLNRFNVRMLMKQIVNYEQKLQKPIAYGFGRITTFQRKSLIENNIPFVAANGQIYLPFLGSYFDLCVKHEQTYGEKFSPTSQMLFLLFLYGNNTYSKSAAATRLRVSPMSITKTAHFAICFIPLFLFVKWQVPLSYHIRPVSERRKQLHRQWVVDNAAGSWRAARKELHFSVGGPRLPGLPRPPGNCKAMLPHQANDQCITSAEHYPGAILGVLVVL